MSLIQRVKNFFNLSLTDEKAWNPAFWNLSTLQSQAGINVNATTAMTYSAVWDAVNQISNTTSSLPLHLMQKKNSRNRIADDRALYRVMHDQWNTYMTAMAGRKVMMAHVLLWGNGYAEIVRNGYGEIIQLWPIVPNRISPEMKDGELVYIVRVDNQNITLPRERVLHVMGPSYDGYQGYSVISMARNGIGLGMALENYGSSFFKNGSHPGIVVSHPGTLKDPTRLRDALAAQYAGLGNSHRMMLLEEAMKVEKLSFPNNDSQFIESRIFQVQEIARWFNMPVHKLKDMSKSSFSNIESEEGSYYRNTILPWLVSLEQSFNMQLLVPTDRDLSGRGRYYFKHAVKGLLRGDTASQTAYYSAMLDRGVFSINDVRELEDMDPVEGGDIHLVPMNMQSLENAGRQPDKMEGTDNEDMV